MSLWHSIAGMDLRQLNSFVHVAETGSFTRAAALLGIAQPALSRQVRALEVELRQTLFERNGRGVSLTGAGQQLLAHGRGILLQVARAQQALESQRGELSGGLTIGLPPSLSRTLTVPLVDAFKARWPRATLSVVEGLSTYALEWLQQGRVDCAVVYNPAPAPGLRLRPVAEEPLWLVSRRAEEAADPPPARLAELATLPLVMPSRPHALRMRVEAALAEAGKRPQVALEIDSVPAILELVQRHALHAVLGRQALRGSGLQQALVGRPVLGHQCQPLVTGIFIAESSQRPGNALQQQGGELLEALLLQVLGAAA